MKILFSLFVLLFLTVNTQSQNYSLRIYNARTNKKTYFRNIGDKVKILTTNSNGKDRLVKSKIFAITKDSIRFQPRNEKYKSLYLHINNLEYIEIRTPGMIASSYTLTIFGILVTGITRSPPPFWSAYRKIDFTEGKWAKEIVPQNISH